jgi:L-ascorbate metabolism protein UlaG (beta-lactamase superfamily)
MQITHLGHACIVVESGSTRLLVDPGAYSRDFDRLTGLDAVLVTHQHADHLDPGRIAAVVANNPDAVLWFEPETAAANAKHGAQALASGDTRMIGDIEVEAVGGRHAFNHDRVPAIGNVGLLIRSAAETLFHPGDAYDVQPTGIDVLGLPLNAPWCAVRDTLDFLHAVNPSTAFPIHDGLLNDTGRRGYLMHIENFGPEGLRVLDLSDAKPYSTT